MLLRVFRKIYKNKWLFLSMLIGVTLALAIICTVPIYSRGILQKVLMNDIEDFQKSEKMNIGIYYGSYIPRNMLTSELSKKYASITNNIYNKTAVKIDLPIISKKSIITLNNLEITLADKDKKDSIKNGFELYAVSEIEKHIVVTKGRINSSQKSKDGCYEVIVPQNELVSYNLRLNEPYNVQVTEKKAFLIRIVGVYDIKKEDLYWSKGAWDPYKSGMIMNNELFLNDIVNIERIPFTQSQWEITYDYKKINMGNINSIISTFNDGQNRLSKVYGIVPQMPIMKLLEGYGTKSEEIKIILWILQTPILIILLLYIFMTSTLIVEQEKNEIAVLKSRGANNLQIIVTYLLQGTVVGSLAIVFGPLLGSFLLRIIGNSNGFLEFVNRSPLQAYLTAEDYKYALIGTMIFMITMIIPVILSCKESIVIRKQKKVRGKNVPIWQKYFLDFALLGIVFYGYKSFQNRAKIVQALGISSSDIPVDPLLYLISTFFILGLGLIILRVYPIILRVILRSSKRYLSPRSYMALLNVARNDGKNEFIMIFLILTIAVGIFNIKAARTLNTSIEQKTKYMVGADLKIKTTWKSIDEKVLSDIKGTSDNQNNNQHNLTKESKKSTFYVEPSFNTYTSLLGKDQVTKVYNTNITTLKTKTNSAIGVQLMGVIPHEFGRIAWFNENLLTYHWFEYLNSMTRNLNAVFLSTSLQEKLEVIPGDRIQIQWGQGDLVDFVVYGFIDYWPTFNSKEGDFVLANLNYMHAKMPKEPYEVWVKAKGPEDIKKLYKAIEQKKLPVTEIQDANQQIIKFKNDSMIKGTNGALTLAFISSMAISAIGLFIYWILAIKGRMLQFGILQALGMSLKQIISMIFVEQILITGISIGIGIFIGNIDSKIFMPLMQIVTDTKNQILPLQLISYGEDYLKMATLFGGIILIIIIMIGIYISTIKMDKAIKLGED
jgi:putative ABC transport system permease protein